MRHLLLSVLVSAALSLLNSSVNAAIITNDPDVYAGEPILTASVSVNKASPYIYLGPVKKPSAAAIRTTSGSDELVTFDLSGDATLTYPGPVDVPVKLNGSASVTEFGKLGLVTGTFDTEITAFDMTGTTLLGPYWIRESPTQASLGKTTITDIGGGLYKIDSYFDIYIERSLDSGLTWQAHSPIHLDVVPEPSTFALAASGLLAVGALVRVRRRRYDK